MSQPTTSILLNSATPAAPTGDQNATFQSDGSTPLQSITLYPKRATASLFGTVRINDLQQQAFLYAADTGAANAYAVTLSPAPTLAAGSVIVFKAANANTGASTLAVNGGSAKSLKKQGSVALAAGDIAASQIVTAVYDGTTWQVSAGTQGATGAAGATGPTGATGPAGTPSVTTKGDLQTFSTVAARIGVGSDGQILAADSTQTTGLKWVNAASGLFYGQGVAVASSGNNTLTLGSTPIANSLLIFAGNTPLRIGTDWSISGAVVTLTPGLAGGTTVVAMWATTNASPGGISLSGGITNAVVRSVASAFSYTSNPTVTFPSGAASGDLVVLCYTGSFQIASTPTGWTLDTGSQLTGSNENGSIMWRVLNSGDISAGGVTLAISGTHSQNVSMICYIGPTGGVREVVASRATGTDPVAVSSSGAVVSTDDAIYYTGVRGGSATLSVNRGTMKTQSNDSFFQTEAVYTESLSAGGVVSASFSGSSGLTNYQAIIIVEGL